MNDREILDNNITLKWTNKDTKNLIIKVKLKFTQLTMRLLTLINSELAVAYAWRIFTTPIKNKNRKKTQFRFDEMSQNQIAGHKIYEYVHNSQGNNNLLVVHGWGSQASDFNSLILSLLDHRFKVVSFDSPAHGLSTGNQTNVIEVAKIIQQLNKKHGGFDAIIGHSFGAIASSFAIANDPSINAKLVTIGAPNKLSTVLHNFHTLLKTRFETQVHFQQYIEKLYDTKVDSFSVENFIKKNSKQTLVIHDEYDKQVPISRAIEISQANPEIELFTTYGLGHNRILNDQTVGQKIVDFIC